MEKQKLILIRNFLFKTFIVGLLLAIFLLVMTITVWDLWSTFVYSTFQISEKELGTLVINSFLNLRLFLIFILLAPAISLHWIIKTK